MFRSFWWYSNSGTRWRATRFHWQICLKTARSTGSSRRKNRCKSLRLSAQPKTKDNTYISKSNQDYWTHGSRRQSKTSSHYQCSSRWEHSCGDSLRRPPPCTRIHCKHGLGRRCSSQSNRSGKKLGFGKKTGCATLRKQEGTVYRQVQNGGKVLYFPLNGFDWNNCLFKCKLNMQKSINIHIFLNFNIWNLNV